MKGIYKKGTRVIIRTERRGGMDESAVLTDSGYADRHAIGASYSVRYDSGEFDGPVPERLIRPAYGERALPEVL